MEEAVKHYYLISANELSSLALGLMEVNGEEEAGGEELWQMWGTWHGQ